MGELATMSLRIQLRLLAGADVHDGGQNERAVAGFDRINPNLHWEFAVVFPSRKQFTSEPHLASLRRNEKSRAMSWMRTAKSFRHKNLDWLVHDLFARISEELFCLPVHKNDPALVVDQNNPDRRRFHRQPEFLLRLLSLCHIDRNTPEDSFSVRSSHV